MLSKSMVKYIQSLGHKKFRDEAGVFIAEGPKIIHEFLADSGIVIQEIFALSDWIREQGPFPAGIRVNEVDEQDLHKISQLTTPNRVLAVVTKPKFSEAPYSKESLVLCLDTIQDPGNFGTILRTADWFGVRFVICSSNCADCFNPKVVQSTMGSIARVRVLYTDLAAWLESAGRRVYGATLDGVDVSKVRLSEQAALLIGNESKGISPELQEKVNVAITIPGAGSAESLNAAVATGIILSHLM